MSDLHYGYKPNHHRCSCGKHFGCGEITPEERAARAARMRYTMPDLMPEVMRYFLESFEAAHGKVFYNITNIGVNDGEFIKSNKGQSLIGPVYDSVSDLFRLRAVA